MRNKDMKNGTNINKRGFTIVELLMVIVAIGILAAIVIVAFNGIQQRANNTQAINNEFPADAGCLGANYPGNQCWQGAQGNYVVTAALDTKLATVMSGSKPTLATVLMPIGINDNKRAGAVYQTSPAPRIVFYLQGINQPCSISGATAANEGGVVTQCLLIL